MKTSELDKYKVDHLFLLIGENPLPNYVATRMLLKDGGTVYLVHSTDTAIQADCIKRRLASITVQTISLGNKGFSSLSDVCSWLSGIWLEHYVLHQIQNISEQFPDIHESAMSFHIDDPDNTDDKYDRFEFDVAFMRDYQLFALSCTTAHDKATCKQKLFEAHLRAKQLGGDEARVALVCLYNNPDRIKRDLEATVRDKKIAVFGCNDLKSKKFAKKMTQWIRENSPQN